MARVTCSGSINPLPSLIRATGHDAAARRCRDAGRKAWTRADYNEVGRTHERLVRACYRRPWDLPGSDWPFLRFSVAEQLQRDGIFDLHSDFTTINEIINELVPPPRELWPHVGEVA